MLAAAVIFSLAALISAATSVKIGNVKIPLLFFPYSETEKELQTRLERSAQEHDFQTVLFESIERNRKKTENLNQELETLKEQYSELFLRRTEIEGSAEKISGMLRLRQENSDFSEYMKFETELMEVKRKLAGLLIYYGKNHPQVIELSLYARMLSEKIQQLSRDTEDSTGKLLVETLDRKLDNCADLRAETMILENKMKNIASRQISCQLLITAAERRMEHSCKIMNMLKPEGVSVFFPWLRGVVFLVLLIVLILLLETTDPLIMNSLIYRQDDSDVFFIINMKTGQHLLKCINEKKNTVLIDLNPENGLFFRMMPESMLFLEECLASAGDQKSDCTKPESNITYIPLKLGSSDARKIFNFHGFYRMLEQLKKQFDHVIVQLPAEAADWEIPDAARYCGKLKVMTDSISRRDYRSFPALTEISIV